MNNYKISVIVPVYNVEAYLKECLNSILNQTLDGIQIIIVNDGSTDGSKAIIDKYSSNHDNIIVVDQENQGLAAARNAGILKATGEYLAFVDSDDFIDITMYERMYNKAKEMDSPLVICDMEQYWSKENTRAFNNLNEDEQKVYSLDEQYKLLLSRNLNCQVMNKIYLRSIWMDNNIQFERNRYYEDIIPSFKIANIYGKAVFINEAMYKYRMREGSITKEPSEKSINDFLYAVNTAAGIAIENTKIDKKELDKYLMAFNVNYGTYAVYMAAIRYKITKNNDDKIFMKNIIKDKFNYNIIRILFNDKLLFKSKIKCILYKLGILYT